MLGLWSVCWHHLLRQPLDDVDVKHNPFGLDGLQLLKKAEAVGQDLFTAAFTAHYITAYLQHVILHLCRG